MLPRVLSKERFEELAAYLMADRRLLAPVSKGHQFAFQRIEAPEQIAAIRMDYDVTILPPKKFLFPVRETLLAFAGRSPEQVACGVAAEPTVLLAVHPYDLHAIATIDAALSADPPDPYYLARRAATLLIGLNICGYANEHQFMADMGTADPPEGGFDLFLTDLGDRYYVEVGTEAGSKLIKAFGLADPAGAADHQARQDFDARKAGNLPKRLPYQARYLPELLEGSYDSLLWEALARRCFSCGTCTSVCPTCYCFDVQDKLNLDAASGTRQRRWDSCQLKVFAEVAGGENFRQQPASRLRHRIFRKGKYVLQRTGKTGCVGCGRCSLHCVANISILEAFQQIAGEAAEVEG